MLTRCKIVLTKWIRIRNVYLLKNNWGLFTYLDACT